MPSPSRSSVALAALALAVLAGCGAGGARVITRRVGGEARAGIFVSPFSYEHFLRGELAYLAGDLRQAAREYELARAGPEDDPLLVARLAETRDRLGQESMALALLREGEALDPRSELVWLTRGRIHERHDRMDEAIEAYSRAASLAPRSEEGPLALSAMLRARGEPEEADAVLERYLERAVGAGAARARLRLAIEHGQPQAAAEAVRSLLEVAPARSDEVRAAVVAAIEGDQPEVALRLLAALPESDADRELRLRALIAAGDRDRAEGLLASWMPRSPAELLHVARGYLAVGLPARAAELARVALSSGGGGEARLILGLALRDEGRSAEAARALAQIERGSAAWPEGPIELARTLIATGWPALAAEVLARASSQRPDAALALALADARARAGNTEGALAALSGDDPRVRADRARLLEELGRVDEAAAVYAALPMDQPAITERDRVRARAEAAWRGGEREEALSLMSSWVERAPEDLHARARYAELLAATDQESVAREVAGRALPLAVDAALRQRLTAIVIEPLARSSAP